MRQDSETVTSTFGEIGWRIATPQKRLSMPEASFVLHDYAVTTAGKAHEQTALIHDLLISNEQKRLLMPLLSHAGPSLMAWSPERGLGPEDVVSPFHDRRSLELKASEWDRIVDDFVAAASRCAQQGAQRVVINVESDSLLGAVLSPRYAPSLKDRHELLTRVLEGVATHIDEIGVLLVVEECAPGGLDPAGGIAAARALQAAGAAFFVTDARSAWFTMRGADTSSLQSLVSAAWLPPRVAVPVFAQVPEACAVADLANVLSRARSLGLRGLVLVPEETER